MSIRQDASVHLFKDFTPFPRWVLRAGKLTTEETGVYLWLLSHDADFTITKRYLMSSFTELGEKKYRKIMAGLERRGLLSRERGNGPGGRRTQDWAVRIPTPEEVDAWD